LEGAKVIGHRSIFIAGVRDPIFTAALEGVLERVRQTVRDFASELSPDSYQLIFHQHGRNGVMAEREPLQHVVSHEVGITSARWRHPPRPSLTHCATAPVWR
jgi:hypothetical protein